MVFINAKPALNWIASANAVFFFQKLCIFFERKIFFKLLVNAELPVFKAASTRQNFVDDFLREERVFRRKLRKEAFLLFDRRQPLCSVVKLTKKSETVKIF